jgi:hypothetical protein
VTDSIEEFLGGYQPPRNSVQITQRADLLARHAELNAAHGVAIRDDMALNRNPEAPAILAELHDLEDEIAASEVTFTFESIGRHKYLRLIASHPPTKKDRSDRLDFNADTFPQALVAASCVSPVMTVEQAVELEERLSDGQFRKLWNAAIGVNIGDDAAPKSALRSLTAAQTETSSNTADLEESPEASFSDE